MATRALVLGSSVRVVVTIARCLHRHGIETHVSSILVGEPPIRSRAVASFQLLPADPVAFADSLIAFVRQHAIEYIYPCGDEVLTLLIQIEEQLRPIVKLGCPPGEIVRRVLDKSITLAAADRIGIPVPREYQFNRAEEFYAAADSIVFPIIAKPRSKEGTPRLRLRYYAAKENLQKEFEQDPEFGRGVLLQEYIPGVGLGIELLMDRGEPLAMFQHRRLTELPITGGVSVRARSEPVDKRLGEYSVRLLKELDWNGVAMVEFRLDPATGRVALMEVNGRYWGSLPLSYFAGVEFPWYEWQLAHGEIPHPPRVYRDVTMRWLAGELQRLPQLAGEVVRRRMGPWQLLKSLIAVPLGFLPPVKDAIWSWNDMTPARDDLCHTWRAAFAPPISQAFGRLVPRTKARNSAKSRFGSVGAAKLYEALRSGRRTHPRPSQHLRTQRLLVLCHGNIIRSPFVERVLDPVLGARGIQVSSAGLGCIPGRPADQRAIGAARSLGIDLDRHRARPATRTLIDDSDVILIMDYRNLAMLLHKWPETAPKVYLVADWLSPQYDSREIVDPYNGDVDDVARCYAILADACRRLADQLA